jgi:hypothetical protein
MLVVIPNHSMELHTWKFHRVLKPMTLNKFWIIKVRISNPTSYITACVPQQLSPYSGLRAGWSGERILVGARFSAPVRTGPGAHPASYTMGTRSFLGIKRPGRCVDHPPPSRADVKERVGLYLYSNSGPSWPVPR